MSTRSHAVFVFDIAMFGSSYLLTSHHLGFCLPLITLNSFPQTRITPLFYFSKVHRTHRHRGLSITYRSTSFPQTASTKKHERAPPPQGKGGKSMVRTKKGPQGAEPRAVVGRFQPERGKSVSFFLFFFLVFHFSLFCLHAHAFLGGHSGAVVRGRWSNDPPTTRSRSA